MQHEVIVRRRIKGEKFWGGEEKNIWIVDCVSQNGPRLIYYSSVKKKWLAPKMNGLQKALIRFDRSTP